MATGELLTNNDCAVKWQEYEATYECVIAVIESDDCFESYVVNLIGALSYGDTVADAVKNAAESASGLIATYKKDGVPIPWDKEGNWYESEESPILVKRVLVNG